jgi:hypothetical protein
VQSHHVSWCVINASRQTNLQHKALAGIDDLEECKADDGPVEAAGDLSQGASQRKVELE